MGEERFCRVMVDWGYENLGSWVGWVCYGDIFNFRSFPAAVLLCHTFFPLMSGLRPCIALLVA